MDTTPSAAAGRHKSSKSSRRSRKHRHSSVSTLSKSSKDDDDRQATKASPGPLAAEASAFTSVIAPPSTQLSPVPLTKPESDVTPESAPNIATPIDRPTAALTPSAHLAFDDIALVEEPVVVASPVSPLEVPAKAPTSSRPSVTSETRGTAAPQPRPGSAASSEAEEARRRTANGHPLKARQRTSDAMPAGVQVPNTPQKQRNPPCVQMVLRALPQVVLAALGVAAVFAAVTLLTPDSKPLDVCRSHSCVEYSSRLRRSVTLLVSPCVSLTRFVCAGWTAHNELGVRQGVVEADLDRLSRLTFALRLSPSRPQNDAQRGSMFFRSCEDVLRGDRNELQNVKRALAEAGITWPHPPPDKPDVLRTLLFAAIRLGWPAILHVDILERSGDDRPASGHKEPTISLTPSREFLTLARKLVSLRRAPALRNAYLALLIDSFASGTGQAVTFEAIKKVEDDFFVLATFSSKSTSRAEKVEASELFSGTLAPESRWRSALAAYGLSSKKGRRLLVWSEHVDFVRVFMDTWKKAGEANTHLFVSWFTVQLAALFARRSFIVSFYGSHRGAQVMHRAFCLARAYLLYGDAAFSSYSADTLFASFHGGALAVASAVREQFRASVAQWPPLNESVSTDDDWNSTDVMLKVVRGAMHKASAGSIDHGQLPFVNAADSLVTTWRTAIATGRAKVLSSRAPIMTAIEALEFHAELDDYFVLMPYAFSFPLYDADALPAINYAGFGAQVAQALGELAFKAYQEVNSSADDSIANLTRCLGIGNVSTTDARALALQVLSFSALFDAYMAADGARDRRLVGFEQLTPAQLFFVAACYARCPGGAHSALPALSFMYAPPEADCDALFQRTAHYKRVFGCDHHATTNAGDECKLSAGRVY